jgi:hypothetical protein
MTVFKPDLRPLKATYREWIGLAVIALPCIVYRRALSASVSPMVHGEAFRRALRGIGSAVSPAQDDGVNALVTPAEERLLGRSAGRISDSCVHRPHARRRRFCDVPDLQASRIAAWLPRSSILLERRPFSLELLSCGTVGCYMSRPASILYLCESDELLGTMAPTSKIGVLFLENGWRVRQCRQYPRATSM